MTTNFDNDMPKLRSIGVECFDIFTPEELAFLTDKSFELGSMTSDLAGHIKKEVEVTNWPKEFEQKILHACKHSNIIAIILESFKANLLSSPLKLNRLWTNYQKKYEFNPVHNHHGALSFVLFIQIPYNLNEEEALFQANGTETSKLQFLPLNHMGEIHGVHANVDQSYECKLLVFNSKLSHTVYPFYTSDDYRITVSGNFVFDNRIERDI